MNLVNAREACFVGSVVFSFYLLILFIYSVLIPFFFFSFVYLFIIYFDADFLVWIRNLVTIEVSLVDNIEQAVLFLSYLIFILFIHFFITYCTGLQYFAHLLNANVPSRQQPFSSD